MGDVGNETERVLQREPRRQGDIIKLEWPAGLSGPPLGIVINADCDLAHGKTDGVIAFVPIYPFRDYLAEFWATGHVDEVCNAATRGILKLAADDDPEALHGWLRSSGPEDVAEKLASSRSLKKKDSEQLAIELRRLAVCLDGARTPLERFQQLCAIASDAPAYAKTHINAAKKAMGEGHFFISEMVDDARVGFVVRMRRIYALPETDYFISSSDQQSRSDGNRPTAVRLGRLTALYKFKVLQLFAQQYSRIGLPDEITALGSLAVDDLVEQFAGARN